jgi:hypothetical protein
MKIDNPYLVGEMFRIISPDSVWSGRTCLANLGVLSGQETHMFSPVEPYQGGPSIQGLNESQSIFLKMMTSM